MGAVALLKKVLGPIGHGQGLKESATEQPRIQRPVAPKPRRTAAK